MLGGGCSQLGVQMLMIHAIFCSVNAMSMKLDYGTYTYHAKEETPLIKGLNNVSRSLEPCYHLVIVIHWNHV